MTRALFTTFIMVSAFFLVSLGMRMPSLDQGGAPKPRPRAVVENLSKSEMVSKSEEVRAESCIPPVTLALAAPEKKGPPLILVATEHPAPHAPYRATRAPPSALPSCS